MKCASRLGWAFTGGTTATPRRPRPSNGKSPSRPPPTASKATTQWLGGLVSQRRRVGLRGLWFLRPLARTTPPPSVIARPSRNNSTADRNHTGLLAGDPRVGGVAYLTTAAPSSSPITGESTVGLVLRQQALVRGRCRAGCGLRQRSVDHPGRRLVADVRVQRRGPIDGDDSAYMAARSTSA